LRRQTNRTDATKNSTCLAEHKVAVFYFNYIVLYW